MRPPFGRLNWGAHAALDSLGYKVILWSAGTWPETRDAVMRYVPKPCVPVDPLCGADASWPVFIQSSASPDPVRNFMLTPSRCASKHTHRHARTMHTLADLDRLLCSTHFHELS